MRHTKWYRIASRRKALLGNDVLFCGHTVGAAIKLKIKEQILSWLEKLNTQYTSMKREEEGTKKMLMNNFNRETEARKSAKTSRECGSIESESSSM